MSLIRYGIASSSAKSGNLELQHPPKKILVIKPSALGDIIHGLPFLNAIRKCFPHTEIHWVLARPFAELLEGHPLLDKLWVIDKDKWKGLSNLKKTASEMIALFRGLKSEKFDIAVDLQGLLRSGIIAYASGAKIRIGLKGFKEAREGSRFFHTHRVATGGKLIHAVDRYLRVAEFLGCDVSDVEFPLVEGTDYAIPVSAPYAVLVPGARWQAKKWAPERFGELAKMLHKEIGFMSVIVGTKADEEEAKKIVSASGGAALSLAGKTTLRELIGIIKKSDIVISTDSGPMHIAAALGKPVFALFGTTSPARTGPYGKTSTVITADLPCSPCFKKKCGAEEAACMDAITPKMVYNAIMERLK